MNDHVMKIKNGEWCDEVMLRSIAKVLHKDIHVIHHNAHETYINPNSSTSQGLLRRGDGGKLPPISARGRFFHLGGCATVELSVFNAHVSHEVIFLTIFSTKQPKLLLSDRILKLKICQKCFGGRGSDPDPAGGAYSAPQTS